MRISRAVFSDDRGLSRRLSERSPNTLRMRLNHGPREQRSQLSAANLEDLADMYPVHLMWTCSAKFALALFAARAVVHIAATLS